MLSLTFLWSISCGSSTRILLLKSWLLSFSSRLPQSPSLHSLASPPLHIRLNICYTATLFSSIVPTALLACRILWKSWSRRSSPTVPARAAWRWQRPWNTTARHSNAGLASISAPLTLCWKALCCWERKKRNGNNTYVSVVSSCYYYLHSDTIFAIALFSHSESLSRLLSPHISLTSIGTYARASGKSFLQQAVHFPRGTSLFGDASCRYRNANLCISLGMYSWIITRSRDIVDVRRVWAAAADASFWYYRLSLSPRVAHSRVCLLFSSLIRSSFILRIHPPSYFLQLLYNRTTVHSISTPQR